MTIEEALQILKDHNAWRRDNGDTENIVMHNPKVIGEAIDVAIAYMQEHDNEVIEKCANDLDRQGFNHAADAIRALKVSND